VSRIARANGRKTALAKYIVAITPNTASTVVDRAITTSFMPRSQTEFFQGDLHPVNSLEPHWFLRTAETACLLERNVSACEFSGIVEVRAVLQQ
jgi:hypothetical protein